MFSFKLKSKNKEAKKPVVSNPKILEVNLIKSDTGASFNFAANLSTLFLVFFIAALLVTEIYFGLDWWQNQEMFKMQATEKEIVDLNREISALNTQTNDAFRYKEKVATLSGLLDNHIYWSNFLNWLEKNTLSSVQYEELNGDLSGSYNFNAKSQTYADVSWQVKAFLNDPLTKKASVSEASILKSKDNEKTNTVSFILRLQVNPAIFKK